MKKEEAGLTILITAVVVPFVASFVNYGANVLIELIEKRRVAKEKKNKPQEKGA